MRDISFDPLFKDGNWRIVRATRPDNGPRKGRWVIIQHKCGGGGPAAGKKFTSMYTDGEWSFCSYRSVTCLVCGTPTDPTLKGFQDMILWDSKEDLS